MDKNRIEGLGKEVAGSIKESLGRLTGDSKTQIEGAAEKFEGQAQKAMGEAMDKTRTALGE